MKACLTVCLCDINELRFIGGEITFGLVSSKWAVRSSHAVTIHSPLYEKSGQRCAVSNVTLISCWG